ncbi:uncharacterized protein [Palaemon carinicauda]|uniref:uncharacterized protein n=1 Tax=Palaemon carinicauda TaxID=392227 RepID=UPI0035B652C7
MTELKRLITSRKFVRKSVTESFNQRDQFILLEASDKLALESKLTDNMARLKDLDLQIQGIKWSSEENESELMEELEACENYQDKLRSSLFKLQSPVPTTPSPPTPALPLLKRPTAPLPRYSGQENEDLTKFLSQFEAVINRYEYSDYEKLLLLKQQITGRALVLIDSLESHNQGYSKAKELLEKALASPDVQKFSTIKQLSELNLDKCDDPFEYVSKVKGIIENVRKLNISIDYILQYFVWTGLNEKFRELLINITNHTWPSIEEISDNFFTACTRYSHHKKKVKVTDHSVDMAINVNFTPEGTSGATAKCYPCSLCSTVQEKASHNIRDCKNFISPVSKVEKLKSIDGCTRCGLASHSTEKCRYKFRYLCANCKGFHWNYLCTHPGENQSNDISQKNLDLNKKKFHEKNKDKKDPKAKNPTERSQNNITTITEALKNSSEGDTILPTFTCNISGSNVRCMKDSGCQSNFISEELASRLNLPVIRECVKLTVNGINVPRSYDTKIVEVEMKFDRDTRVIYALCLPNINITLNLPKLNRVVNGFLSKGYKLADTRLLDGSEDISDIQLILGSKSSYCIPETEIVFGEKSIYSRTPHGVVLKGATETILHDLPYLPYAPEVSSSSYISITNRTPDYLPSEEAKFYQTSNIDFGKIEIRNESFVLEGEDDEVSGLVDMEKDVLDSVCDEALDRETSIYSETVEIHTQLVNYVLEKTTRNSEGRLVMPLLWNPRVSHLLGHNFNISEKILSGLQRKFQGNLDDTLKQINMVFKEQADAGIIERIENLDKFKKEHPESSFMPFMGIFKPDRETTKCRVVFLSNLSDKGSMNHNQTMHAGPTLNQKLSTSIINLRFGSKLCCFDIKKAFNNIGLEEVDQNRLCFLWFRNLEDGDFSIIGYKNSRLPFGLRCSPALLMLGLYKILILDSTNDSFPLMKLKRTIYQLSYMDNCAFTAETSECLLWMYTMLEDIFSPYKFSLQQFLSNDMSLQKEIDKIQETETPTKSKLLGLEWDRMSDTLSTKPIQLDINSSTKRKVLSTIASQFDLLNFNGPILNRARLFLHRLQCRPELDWDEKLTAPLINEWKNICKQANSAPSVEFPRNFGARTDKYKLVGFADSSKVLFGAAVYLYNISTNKIYFILARNKLVSKQLESKSIPSLELQALALTVETVKDLKNELSGFGCIDPIEIVGCEVYSDSLVVLTWLQSYALKLDKLQKKQPFILNRLEYINKLCEDSCMKFSFVSGEDNPADCITRPLSFRQLMKTNYITGPKFITESESNVICSDRTLSFIIPGLFESKQVHKVETNCGSACSPPNVGSEHLFPFNRVSSFEKAVRVHAVVLRFCSILKSKFKSKHPALDHFEVEDEGFNFYDEACRQIIIRDQHIHFPDVFDYFHSKQKQLKNLPNIVAQLNLFLDSDGMVRVKSKCRRLKEVQHLNKFNYPLLLSKDSMLVPLIIRELHVKLSHAGCYPLLAELRRNFWITHIYSTVKKVLSNCITCKRLNERVIKLNQSHYPEFRINPENIPYRQIFIDHMGPFKIKNDQGNTVKVWLLCITCLWSRAINLKICMDLTSEEFIRALQLHTYEFGIPSLCLSDLGSQFVAGANQVSSFLSDYETNAYLQEHGIKSFKFEQYYKGCNQLGSLVESCVKLTKRLLFGAMRNNILPLRDFDFIVHKTIHLVNRRPISFKESLRDSSGESIPEIITPEMLIHGRESVSINIIPQLQGPTDADPEFNADQIPSSLLKLQNVRHNLIKIYNEEFVGNLIYQAVNKKDRYKPVQHKELKVGDIVLLKEPLAKPCNYPMGRIKEIVKNINNEVTAVKVFKGKTGEILKRHSSSIIPLLSVPNDDEKQGVPDTKNVHIVSSRPKRKAAIQGAAKIHQILAESD